MSNQTTLDFVAARDDEGGYDKKNSQNLQSSSQITTTNKPNLNFFTGKMPFMPTNKQIISLKAITNITKQHNQKYSLTI